MTTTLTLLESLRNRMALGKSVDEAVSELVKEIVEDTEELEAAFLALAPYALKQLERSTVRTQLGAPLVGDLKKQLPAIPVAGTHNERKPLMDWGIREVDLAIGYFRTLKVTVTDKLNAFKAVRALLTGNKTVKSVWDKLDQESRNQLAEHGGIRQIASKAS